MNTPRRILVIRLSSAGDVVSALPLANFLKEKFPECHLAWLVSSKCRALLEGHPAIDELVVLERRGGLGKFLTVAKLIRERKFDVVIDAQAQFRSGVLAWLSGAPTRIGFEQGVTKEPNGIFLTDQVKISENESHNVSRFLALASKLSGQSSQGDVEAVQVNFGFPTFEGEAAKANNFISRYTKVIGLSIAGSVSCKRWSAKNWAGLVDQLIAKNYTPLVLWGPGEQQWLSEIEGQCKTKPLKAPPTNWKELSEIMRRCEAVVGNDSGPLHLASALGVKTIGLFGPTSIEKNGPFGQGNVGLRGEVEKLSCYRAEGRLLDRTRCKFFRTCTLKNCIDLIEVREVLERVEALV